MPNRDLALLPCLLLTTTIAAQQAPSRVIEVRAEGLAKGDTVYLANYYGNKLFYADTAVADAKATARFDDAKGYKAGVYAVVVPGPKYFEVVVNEPRIVLHTTLSDLNGDLQVKESLENKLFLDYIHFLAERKAEGDALRERMGAAKDPIAKAGMKADMEDLDRRVKEFQRKLIADNPGTLAAGLVHMSMPPELPEIRKADGTLDSLAAYHQFRRHYWDHFDLTDERIVRVPIFANKLEEYMTKLVPQVPDTITRLADALIARTEASEEVFKYVVHSYTHKYETSDIMGMDAVFVHMAQTYYCPAPGRGSRATWMSDEKLEKLCERARKLAPLTLGKPAKDIILTDSTEQRWISFHKLPAEYVVIVFWDPHCGVCKKELPALHEVYKEKLKALGVEVFAVAKAVDDGLLRDWKKFIREKDLDWVNVALTKTVYEEARKDPMKYIPKLTTLESLNYADTYDVYSTPKIFLVDGDRKIVGKQLAPEQIEDLVKRLKERKNKE
ncbi:MAG: DUF5106 domain-containing protein [Flavobacteriales bacterium]|nr:DUF5106 domain-containing protein [Flavobacteriales bacterium]